MSTSNAKAQIDAEIKKKYSNEQIFVAFPIKMGLYLQINHKTGSAKTEISD